jgi:hypothetical protein
VKVAASESSQAVSAAIAANTLSDDYDSLRAIGARLSSTT